MKPTIHYFPKEWDLWQTCRKPNFVSEQHALYWKFPALLARILALTSKTLARRHAQLSYECNKILAIKPKLAGPARLIWIAPNSENINYIILNSCNMLHEHMQKLLWNSMHRETSFSISWWHGSFAETHSIGIVTKLSISNLVEQSLSLLLQWKWQEKHFKFQRVITSPETCNNLII